MVMIFLTYSSLLSVYSYTALSILTTIASIKIYAFVMIKMGKVEHDFDPLASVSLSSDFNMWAISSQISSVSLTLPESTVIQYTPAATSAFNKAATGVRSLFLLENPVSFYKV